MAKKFKTATLSHDDIRSQLWKLVEAEYPCSMETGGWPYLVDVYDGFFIANVRYKGTYALYRVDYTIADDVVAISGVPREVEQVTVYKGTMDLVASSTVATADEAKELLGELIEGNPLFAALDGSPNAHFIVFDLTTVGKKSQHAGLTKYKLAASGLAAALPTLISKPIHVTASLDDHFEPGQPPKPIGTFLGAVGIDNPDGTKTVRAIGTLWERDFPDEVETIKAQKDKLGASYEITYTATAARRIDATTVEIADYEFSGAAILKKTAAAHPETKVHVARTDPSPSTARALSALRPPTPAVAATAARPKGGARMKYQGIPTELEATVEALIAAAMADTKEATERAELQAAVTRLTSEGTEKDTRLATATARVTALEGQATESTTALEAAKTELETEKAARAELQAAADKAALDTRVEAEWTKLAAKHGFKPEQKAAKLPLLTKLVVGKEPMTIEETEKLFSGAATGKPAPKVPGLPLTAGAGEPERPSLGAMVKKFPALSGASIR